MNFLFFNVRAIDIVLRTDIFKDVFKNFDVTCSFFTYSTIITLILLIFSLKKIISKQM